MEEKIQISYDEIEDIFYLGKKDKVKFSMDLALPSGDVVVDLGFDGLIKGIEIFNASKFFSLVKEDIQKIKNADFKVIYSPSYVALNISFGAKNKGIIKSNIIVPYNKKLVLN
jgi:uncharacterized protein YuzE